MSRQTFSARHMGNRPIYCRLSRTSVTSMYCEELVFSVSNITTFTIAFFKISGRCQGHRTDLDGELSQFLHSRELTEKLVEESLVKTLWDDYGIIADTVVTYTFYLI